MGSRLIHPASATRRGQPIRAYVGGNGGGKTLAAVYDLLPSLDQGRPVLSTAPPYNPETGELHASYVPLTSWRQLAEAEHADVLLDEVTGVASARSFAALPPQLLHVFVQLRKRDLTVTWTTPNYARADVVLREVTRAVTVCRGRFPKVHPESKWPSNRLFTWNTYDAQEYEQVVLAKADKMKLLQFQWLWRRREFRAAKAYRTLDAVSLMDHTDMTGMCLECGGQRRAPKCECDPTRVASDHDHARPAREPRQGRRAAAVAAIATGQGASTTRSPNTAL